MTPTKYAPCACGANATAHQIAIFRRCPACIKLERLNNLALVSQGFTEQQAIELCKKP